MQATASKENDIFSEQAASLAGILIVQRTQAAEEVNLAETQIALVNGVNVQLHATLAAGSTPTVVVVPGRAEIGVGSMDELTSEQSIILTGVSSVVDPTTGCVVGVQEQFLSNIEQIFITMRSYNIVAGMELYAEWKYEGTLRIRQDWVVDITSIERCLWFRLDSTDTAFTPGNWSVSIYANAQNVLIGNPVTFSIIEE